MIVQKYVLAACLAAVLNGVSAARESGHLDFSAIKSPLLFAGDGNTAYRDPAAYYWMGMFYVYMSFNSIGVDGLTYWQTAWSKSADLVNWTKPRPFTPMDRTKNLSSPGNVIRDGDEFVLCVQTYPTPVPLRRTRPGEPVPVQFGDGTARLWTMRSKDLENWGAPELIRVMGPDVPEDKMGRLIDPFLLRDKDDPTRWWCFYKKAGHVGYSWSLDLRTWTPAGVAAGGENPCVIVDDREYVLFYSPRMGIGVKRSADLKHWRDDGLLMLGVEEGGTAMEKEAWDWARGRLSAGFVLDLRREPRVGMALLFFHGSRWPERDHRGGWATHAGVGMAWSADLKTWSWPGQTAGK